MHSLNSRLTIRRKAKHLLLCLFFIDKKAVSDSLLLTYASVFAINSDSVTSLLVLPAANAFRQTCGLLSLKLRLNVPTFYRQFTPTK